MTTHTPTPWDSKPAAGYEIHGQSIIWNDSGKTIAVVYTNVADAAFIVRAVNNHTALVEALEDIINLGEYDDDGNYVLKSESNDGTDQDTTVPAIAAALRALRTVKES